MTFTRDQWARDVSVALGNTSPSRNVLDFVIGWTTAETNTNSGAKFNLLNTEWREPDSTDFNSAGVQNFSSYKEGIDATVNTLKNGFYPDIVQALRWNNDNALLGPNSAILNELNSWCGGCNYGNGFVTLGQAHRNDPFDYGSAPAQAIVPPSPSGPTDVQRKEAIDCWNSFFGTLKAGGADIEAPPTGTGIFNSWLDLWVNHGKQMGPPVTWEYDSNDWSGKHIVVQEFAHARCEWNGAPNWYSSNGKLN